MCQELTDELEQGKEAAKALAKHLEVMGADKLTRPVETDDGCYRVTIIKTL